MGLTLLPYEILQHISTWLLPRYQCRLALASKWCYQYLYTDLLRWHAKWRLLAPPRYNYDNYYSVIEFNNQVVLCNQSHGEGRLYIHNLTHMWNIFSGSHYEGPEYLHYEMGFAEMVVVCKYIAWSNVLTGFHKYMNKSSLHMYIDSRNYLTLLPWPILTKLLKKLNNEDKSNLARSTMYLAGVKILFGRTW